MHLADLQSYLEADKRLVELYADPDAWARKAILNVAGSGKFSSDRTIAEYAADIWNVQPCPVPYERLTTQRGGSANERLGIGDQRIARSAA